MVGMVYFLFTQKYIDIRVFEISIIKSTALSQVSQEISKRDILDQNQ